MNLLEMFRGKAKEEKALDANPYLNAKRAWNEHTGAVISSRQLWQAVALIALLIALGALGGLIHQASQSKFVPYVVEVDKLGQDDGTRWQPQGPWSRQQ